MIAHDARAAGLALVYWWDNENEIHGRFFASPLDDPTALVPNDGTGLACVWEMEVLDFERRAWLEDVLKNGDLEAYPPGALPTPRSRPLHGFVARAEHVGQKNATAGFAPLTGSSVLSARQPRSSPLRPPQREQEN